MHDEEEEDDDGAPQTRWGMDMQFIERLIRRGPIRARDLAQQNLNPNILAHAQWSMVPAVALARGTYGYAQSPRIVIGTTRYPKSVACLYSALWLHGLLLREPDDAWLLVRHKGRPRTKDPGLPMQIIRTSRWPTSDDLSTERKVATTSLARTVIDFFRYRGRVGAHAPEAVREIVLASGLCTREQILECADRSQIAIRQLAPRRMPADPPVIVRARTREAPELAWRKMNRPDRDDWEKISVRDWDGYFARLGKKAGQAG